MSLIVLMSFCLKDLEGVWQNQPTNCVFTALSPGKSGVLSKITHLNAVLFMISQPTALTVVQTNLKAIQSTVSTEFAPK